MFSECSPCQFVAVIKIQVVSRVGRRQKLVASEGRKVRNSLCLPICQSRLDSCLAPEPSSLVTNHRTNGWVLEIWPLSLVKIAQEERDFSLIDILLATFGWVFWMIDHFLPSSSSKTQCNGARCMHCEWKLKILIRNCKIIAWINLPSHASKLEKKTEVQKDVKFKSPVLIYRFWMYSPLSGLHCMGCNKTVAVKPGPPCRKWLRSSRRRWSLTKTTSETTLSEAGRSLQGLLLLAVHLKL